MQKFLPWKISSYTYFIAGKLKMKVLSHYYIQLWFVQSVQICTKSIISRLQLYGAAPVQQIYRKTLWNMNYEFAMNYEFVMNYYEFATVWTMNDNMLSLNKFHWILEWQEYVDTEQVSLNI